MTQQIQKHNQLIRYAAPAALVAVTISGAMFSNFATASSHREAPFITENPKVDGTDFYMFNSYESGREGFVTIVANYLPLQDPYGGPNYFFMDPNAVYDIHIDNDGDASEDMTFRFRFNNELQSIALPIGDEMVPIPLIQAGGVGPGAGDNGALNIIESYSVEMIANGTGPGVPIVDANSGGDSFLKPVDNIGNKTIADYEAYANDHIYDIVVPGCETVGRMFVGQRKDPFVVNLGETFDLVNTNPLGPVDAEADDLADKNITSLILELPAACLTAGESTIIGAWTTASLPRARVLTPNPTFDKPSTEQGTLIQVSRLGMPLVNEVVVGLPDKNLFNASQPSSDGQFLTYVTNPTLPALLEILFGVQAPCLPRNDLVAVFLTGVDGLNQPMGVTPSEQLRLNTAIPAVPAASQNTLGVLGGDTAGFPNGRRPGDDVVDAALRVVMGVLLDDTCAPDGQLAYTDGAAIDATVFQDVFPYLNTPIPGSPNPDGAPLNKAPSQPKKLSLKGNQ